MNPPRRRKPVPPFHPLLRPTRNGFCVPLPCRAFARPQVLRVLAVAAVVALLSGLGIAPAAAIRSGDEGGGGGGGTAYPLTYVKNDGTDASIELIYNYGTRTALPNSAASFTRPGYILSGWSSLPDGSDGVLARETTFTTSGYEVFYAQWTVACTITFDANGGSGSMTPLVFPCGQTVLYPAISGITRAGYAFSKWGMDPDPDAPSFAPGATFGTSASSTPRTSRCTRSGPARRTSTRTTPTAAPAPSPPRR